MHLKDGIGRNDDDDDGDDDCYEKETYDDDHGDHINHTFNFKHLNCILLVMIFLCSKFLDMFGTLTSVMNHNSQALCFKELSAL